MRPVTSARTFAGAVWRGAAVVTAALAAVLLWTRPLAAHLTTHILGAPGDNVTFLWDFWWLRYARAHGLDLLRTDVLFAPYGTDLSLHTLVALPAYLGATLLGWLPLVQAHNVVLLGVLALNGLACYWLLYDMTGDRAAAGCGALVFAGSPYLAAHLLGHFNLLCAATLPLIALSARRAGDHDRRWTLALGALLGVTAYLDYYYTLFGVGLALWMLVVNGTTLHVSRRQRRSPVAARVALVASLLIAAAIAAIAITGGGQVTLAGRPVSLRGTFNLRQAFWLCAAAWIWFTWTPTCSIASLTTRARLVRTLALAGVVAGVCWAPLAVRLAQRWMAGDFPRERPAWLSGTAGVDLASLLLAHPFGALTGSGVQSLYERLSIDPIECSAWLGLVPLVLVVSALRRGRDADIWPWAGLGALAFVWALGSHVRVLGVNTGMMLPFAVIRYLPGISGARIPGRAMAIVSLAAAALVALEIARRRASGWRGRHLALVAAALTLELVPATYPLTATAVPPAYAAIDTRAPGSVLELPVGIRDGFGERGRLDPMAQWAQSVHERPLVGGFVARLPPSVTAAYAADPVLAPLLDLSAGRTRPDLDVAWARTVAPRLRALGIHWVVLRRDAPELVQALVQQPGFSRVAEGDARAVYLVTP